MIWRLLLLSALTLLPLTAQAPPSFVAWWENPVANGLTLTEAQKHRINHEVNEHRDRLIADRQEVERAEQELEAVFNADSVDFQRGRAATEALVKARGQLTQDMVRMSLRLRSILTPEQWKSLQDRSAERAAKGPRSRGRGAGEKNPRHIR